MSKADLKATDYTLNIRRYADNAPPPEPHTVRADLAGGVRKVEVTAKQELFAAHDLNAAAIFVERDAAYYDFAPSFKTLAAQGFDGLVAGWVMTIRAALSPDEETQWPPQPRCQPVMTESPLTIQNGLRTN